MASLSCLEAHFLDVTSDALNNHSYRKQSLVSVNKDAHQRETITLPTLLIAIIR